VFERVLGNEATDGEQWAKSLPMSLSDQMRQDHSPKLDYLGRIRRFLNEVRNQLELRLEYSFKLAILWESRISSRPFDDNIPPSIQILKSMLRPFPRHYIQEYPNIFRSPTKTKHIQYIIIQSLTHQPPGANKTNQVGPSSRLKREGGITSNRIYIHPNRPLSIAFFNLVQKSSFSYSDQDDKLTRQNPRSQSWRSRD